MWHNSSGDKVEAKGYGSDGMQCVQEKEVNLGNQTNWENEIMTTQCFTVNTRFISLVKNRFWHHAKYKCH